jgi:hypothetical protein
MVEKLKELLEKYRKVSLENSKHHIDAVYSGDTENRDLFAALQMQMHFVTEELEAVINSIKDESKVLLISYEDWVGDFKTREAQEEQVNKFYTHTLTFDSNGKIKKK